MSSPYEIRASELPEVKILDYYRVLLNIRTG